MLLKMLNKTIQIAYNHTNQFIMEEILLKLFKTLTDKCDSYPLDARTFTEKLLKSSKMLLNNRNRKTNSS